MLKVSKKKPIFSSFRNVFGQLEKLEELYLDHNNLHSISYKAFSAVNSLIRLELQFNHLSFKPDPLLAQFPEADDPYLYGQTPFNNLNKLKYLLLQHNKVESMFVDWTLTNIELEELDLSFNSISYLTANDIQFPQPGIVVNLTNNQISTIDLKDLELYAENQNDRQSPAKIHLGYNPLNCSCITLPLVQFSRNSAQIRHKFDLDLSGLQCVKPMKLRGQSVATVDPYDLLCPLDSSSTMKKMCPYGCQCSVRIIDYAILVNCTAANLTSVPLLPVPRDIGLQHIELDLSDNYLSELPSISFPGYNNVSVLVVEGNNLSKLEKDNIPEHIRVLKLANNQLEFINGSVLEHLNRTTSLRNLTLSSNDWICDCSTVNFLNFVQSEFRKITDLSQIKCVGGETLIEMGPGDFCSEDNLPIILAAIILALLGVLVALGAILYMKYSQEIKVWLFAKGWHIWPITEDELDEDKKFDAFVSFSQRDEDLVAEYLVPELESGEFPYKLCIHFRDWMVGDVISDQVSPFL